MIHKIWAGFIIIGIVYGILSGNVGVINEEILASSKDTLDLVMETFPLMILWSGIMQIAKDAGGLSLLAKFFNPVLRYIFPELKETPEALEYIASNLTINMLGIHNASTPFGLKAMKVMQDKNKDKSTATRSMITFLVLNTSGVTLIATDIIAVRMMYGSKNPTDLILPTLIATVANTVLALMIDRIFYKGSERS